MSIGSRLKSIVWPNPKDILNAPKKARQAAKNAKLNEINIKYWDRHFKHPHEFVGIIDHTTAIPIIYFNSPKPAAIIDFDDASYVDEQGRPWIEVVEDYAFGLDRNNDLARFLNVQYFNDFAEGKVEGIQDEGFKAYQIPLMLNRIPREVIRINAEQHYNPINKEYIQMKETLTQDLLQQLGTAVMMRDLGNKESGGFILLILGMFPGAIIGMFVYASFFAK